MKKLLAFSLITLFVSSVHAQVGKGGFMVGGSMGVNNSKSNYTSGSYTNEYKSTSLSINPQASYFVAKGLAIGIAPSYSYAKSKVSYSPAESSNHTWAIGPVIRYYIPFDRFALFAHTSYNFGWRTTHGSTFDINFGTVTNYTANDKLNTFRGGIGATYFITNNVGIEGLFLYQKQDISYGKPNDGNQSSPSINFNIGFQIYLQKKSGN